MGLKRNKIYKFSQKLLRQARAWVEAGWSFNSFAANHNVDQVTWKKFAKEIPELKQLNDDYKAGKFEEKIRRKRLGQGPILTESGEAIAWCLVAIAIISMAAYISLFIPSES